MKKGFHWPILLAALVLAVVLYIVLRPDSSSITSATKWLSSHIEGFAVALGDTPKCPTGFKFFNDKRGESFCCGGTVNPYTHTCEATEPAKLCAFKPEMKDPRNPSTELPLCSSMIAKNTAAAAKEKCPGKFPNYASIGKCCLTDTDLDGHDCTSRDRDDPTRYCVTGTRPLKAGEKRCGALQMEENAFCPGPLRKIPYTLGASEEQKYGSAAKGLTIPVCFGMESSCIPNNVIETVQVQGVYAGKNVNNWKYACSQWEKVHLRRDLTGSMDSAYL
jgi:hypothetical protein